MGNGCREGKTRILDLAIEGGGTHIDEGALCGLLVCAVGGKLADRLLDDLSILGGDLARQREAVLPAVSDCEVRDIGRIGHAHPADQDAASVIRLEGLRRIEVEAGVPEREGAEGGILLDGEVSSKKPDW